ncbi:MAG: hypothetical protein AAB403_12595 [Planctomycetota bacterium]
MRGRRINSRIAALWWGLFALPAAAQTQPFSLRMVGQIGGPTQTVAVQGNYAYVGVGLRLVVLDVSNPATMREVGATAPFPHFVEGVAVSGTHAYVAAGGAGLRVVDVSKPERPMEIGAWDTPHSRTVTQSRLKPDPAGERAPVRFAGSEQKSGEVPNWRGFGGVAPLGVAEPASRPRLGGQSEVVPK